jgi:hypothetical protein
LQGTSASRHRQEAFLEALNDKGQQQMARAWPKIGVAQQEALKEPEVVATQQEAPEEPEVKDEVDDQLQVTYRLVELQFTFNDFFIIEVTNSNFAGCKALS